MYCKYKRLVEIERFISFESRVETIDKNGKLNDDM